jgi:D-alanine-D-alanine ligase-like ATP-grasp enzyme
VGEGYTPIDAAVLDLLPRAGRVGRELAVRVDLARSLGLRNTLARASADARLRAIPTGASRLGYEEMWRDAAEEVGAEVRRIDGGFLEFSKGPVRARVWNHVVPLDNSVSHKLSLDKTLVHRLLAADGLRVPDHLEFDSRTLAAARDFMAAVPGHAYVVKPVTSEAGSGVTTSVRTPRQLRRAVLRASRLDRRLVIERQAEGHVHRVLMLDGEMLDVVRRLPPSVVGDGHSSVAELIAAENDRRIRRAGGRGRPQLLLVDLDCLFTLEAAGLTVRSVLPAGVHVQVKTSVSQNGPAQNESVVRDGAPAAGLVAEARRAVELLGLRLAVVEIVTPDVSLSLRDAGGVIVEVNAPPGLSYHYDVREPEHAVRVAVPILRRILAID